ncbi:MAG: DNA polymerase III subunit tau [candidate division CPR1 bacterium ADurb.Bin160]|uniref:DNA polymerase III subunit tau n=1 Tax=candidate division CPR1 bacterium ADurb.Bin160 TaxID=1852826 RepID=A0A1V5ZHS8_9BACT|nr:MAG: DNA polymerase III subunit tau [candidate division CPR1 bacterium ADurb.Bin160]
MGLKEWKGNYEAVKILQNELRKDKDSGTYFFYGRKGIDLKRIAIDFAKAIMCKEEEIDFCNKCRDCHNIEKNLHSDLHILTNDENLVKIDDIREIIEKATTTSYEGGKKVFIIDGIKKLRQDSANAMLKTIEEPSKNTFFLLLSNDLKVLPTILSRSIIVNFKTPGYKDLDVDEKIFSFFEGNIKDIESIKNIEYDFSKKENFENIGEKIKLYIETENISYKADMIKCIEDFCSKARFLDKLDRLKIAESIERTINKDRNILKEILYLFMLKYKKIEKMEELLKIKESISANVNLSTVVYSFFMNI